MKTARENNAFVIFLEGEINAQNVSVLQSELEKILPANSGEDIILEAKKAHLYFQCRTAFAVMDKKTAGEQQSHYSQCIQGYLRYL